MTALDAQKKLEERATAAARARAVEWSATRPCDCPDDDETACEHLIAALASALVAFAAEVQDSASKMMTVADERRALAAARIATLEAEPAESRSAESGAVESLTKLGEILACHPADIFDTAKDARAELIEWREAGKAAAGATKFARRDGLRAIRSLLTRRSPGSAPADQHRCGIGGLHEFGAPGCEYHDHHCGECHRRGVCTKAECCRGSEPGSAPAPEDRPRCTFVAWFGTRCTLPQGHAEPHAAPPEDVLAKVRDVPESAPSPGCGRNLMFGGYRCGEVAYQPDRTLLLCDECKKLRGIQGRTPAGTAETGSAPAREKPAIPWLCPKCGARNGELFHAMCRGCGMSRAAPGTPETKAVPHGQLPPRKECLVCGRFFRSENMADTHCHGTVCPQAPGIP